MIPRPEWNLILTGWFLLELLCTPVQPGGFYMFRAFDMGPRTTQSRSLLLWQDWRGIRVVYWSTFNLNCHMAVSGTTPVLINYHCPTTCCLIRTVIHYCQLPMDPTDFFLMWISIKLTVMRHNLKMLDKKPKKPECVLLLQTDRNAWKSKLHVIFFFFFFMILKVQIQGDESVGKPEIYF